MGKDTRPLSKKNRSEFHLNVWGKAVLEETFECRVVFEGTKRECEEEEKRLIKLYGKRVDDSGTLCNFADGGHGGNTVTEKNREQRGRRISKKLLEYWENSTHREEHKKKVQKREKFTQEQLNEKYGSDKKGSHWYFNVETKQIKMFQTVPEGPWVQKCPQLREKYTQEQLNEKYGSDKKGSHWYFNTETRQTKRFQTPPDGPWVRGRKHPTG